MMNSQVSRMQNDTTTHAICINQFDAISEIHIERPMDPKFMLQGARVRTFHEASIHGL